MRRIVLVDIGGASASGMIVSSPVDPPFSSPIDDSPTIDNSPTIDGSPIHDSLLDYLISWWDYEEEGDATFTRFDSHGSNHFNSNSNVYQFTTGLINNCVGDVAGGYLSRADSGLSGIDFTTGDFTLACWYNSNATDNNTGLLSRYDTGSDNRMWSLLVEGGQPTFALSDDGTGGGTTILALGSAPAADAWHLCVAWRDTASNLIYLQVDNGTPVSAAFSGAATVHNGTVDLYALSLNASLYGSALRADSAAIWSRMLTTDERTHLYNSGAGLQYSDLIV